MKRTKLSNDKLDNTEKEIILLLDSFLDPYPKNDNNSTWTNGLKKQLTKLGQEKGYEVATSSKKVKNKDWGEWLVDLMWYKNCYKNYKDGTLKSVFLVAEIEWLMGDWDIQIDFEKLMVLKSKYRLMIFQAPNEDKVINRFKFLKSIIDNYKSSQIGDRYLLVGFDAKKRIFIRHLKVY
ncbi:MAG TPA: hypothetical protein VN026_01120 [Bacteroidia bacterium]|jgi:hypothetical protein|nr:hypothetical protein [Bacteroidia bacterium]